MQDRRGFTILELMLTLTLISAVAAVAIPVYFSRSEVTLESAAVLLARDLRAAQNRSAYLGVPARIHFLENGDGYEVLDGSGAIIRNPRTDLPFLRHYSSDGVFEGVTIVQVRAGDDRHLGYDERGFATESATFTLAFGDDTRLVSVERKTGAITILGSTSGWSDLGY